MKKWICAALAVLLVIGMLAACGAPQQSAAKRSVVVTVFPIYDWVMELLGDMADEWDVIFLLDNGVDLHSYQPTAEDMIKIAACDLFIYVGGNSDNWVADALKGTVNPAQKSINLMETLGDAAKEEEIVEGMEAEEEEEEEEGGTEYDEHVWLSLRCTESFVSSIASTLSAIDAENASMSSFSFVSVACCCLMYLASLLSF